MDKETLDSLLNHARDTGFVVLKALAVWIIGRALIRFALGVMVARLEGRKVDHTIVGYARNTLNVALNIALSLALLSILGIETTSFAALIAGAGLAIGAAWGGLLTNLAAGAFLVVLRPFKAGDQVTAAGVTGVVKEVGLFVTTLITPDHVQTFVGNGKILGSTLRNYDANPARRVDLVGGLERKADPMAAIEAIRARLATLPHVATDPAPEVRLMGFGPSGWKLAIRPYTPAAHYWDVVFASVENLRDLVHSLHLGASEEELEAEDFEPGEASGEEE